MLEPLFISRDLVKVLDFFLQHSNYEYPKKEIMVLYGKCHLPRLALLDKCPYPLGFINLDFWFL